VIVGAVDNKGKHYASIEQERGGRGSKHDFIDRAFDGDMYEYPVLQFNEIFKSILDGSYYAK
jgi:hypothetical protein